MSRCNSSWKVNLFWALFGVIVGNLATDPMENAKAWVHEARFHGQRYLEEGKTIRSAAITEGSEAKHRAANAAFERSAKAGTAEALAQLGIAYCIGLGVRRERREGYGLIIEAVKRDGRLGAIYLGDPEVCPEKK